MNPKAMFELLKKTFAEWNEDKAPRLAAALAYYTVFSLAPLLIIVIAISGLVFGREAAQGQIVGQIQGLVGEQGAQVIQTMIEGASKPSASILATIIGLATLLLGAGGLFGQLQDALNTIWEVQPKPGRGIFGMLQTRFLSFTLVVGTGFLLLVSLVLSAALQAFSGYLGGLFPNAGIVLQIVNILLSFAVITLLFAMIYKVLPDVKIAWSDVWIGAVATALLFTIGKFLIELYLGRSSTASTFGAAGSLVVLLLWVYYAAQILLLGAEFTQVYANQYGSHVVPSKHAMAVPELARAHQGIPHSETKVAKKEGAKDYTTSRSVARRDLQPMRGKKSPLEIYAPIAIGTVVGVLLFVSGARRSVEK
jgi:membrane protein